MTEPPPSDSSNLPWQPRFGLTTLMLLTTVFCVMGTAGYHLLRSRGVAGIVGSRTPPQAIFVIFTVAAPMLLLVALSLGRGLVARWSGSSGRRQR